MHGVHPVPSISATSLCACVSRGIPVMAKSLQWSLERSENKKAKGDVKAKKDESSDSSVYMDCDFTDAILKTEYAGMRDMHVEYEIFLDNGNLHWFIMVRPNEGLLLPYIIFEITTDSIDKGDIIPVMRVIPNPFGNAELTKSHIAYLRKSTSSLSMRITQWLGLSSDDRTLPEVALQFAGIKAHTVGTVKIRMIELCQIAQSKCTEMQRKKYNLFTNNCQHFCNMLLREMNLHEEPTTTGTSVPKDEIQSLFYRSSAEAVTIKENYKLQFKG